MSGPEAQAFFMPAEWEPQRATWLAWPHEHSDWPGKFEAIAWVYADIVRRLSRAQQVCILVQDGAAEESARMMLRRAGNSLETVRFFQIPTDRSWTRDFCPLFVRKGNGSPVVLNWQFNGWAKYDNWQADNAVPTALSSRLALPLCTPVHNGRPIVLEGGSIDVNGAGSILTTEECLLSQVQQRNPGFERCDYESIFARYLGARHTLWLRNGIAGDDTHGHIDDLARFVDPETVVVASEEDPSDANFEPLRENLALLKEMRDQDGSPLRILTLPMPEPVFFDEQRLPASYANFYIANELVLVPTFNDPRDRHALQILTGLFPTRRVVGIASSDLVLGLGTLHCMTQQQPA